VLNPVEKERIGHAKRANVLVQRKTAHQWISAAGRRMTAVVVRCNVEVASLRSTAKKGRADASPSSWARLAVPPWTCSF